MSEQEDHQQDNFVSTFIGILLLLVGFTIFLIILAQGVSNAGIPPQQDPGSAALIEQRIAPVGQVEIATAEEMALIRAAESGEVNGEATYNSACFSCHAAGVAGAPKLGDAPEWETRLSKGTEVLYDHSINGFNAMPAKGGFTNLSDEQVRAAVDYMLEQIN